MHPSLRTDGRAGRSCWPRLRRECRPFRSASGRRPAQRAPVDEGTVLNPGRYGDKTPAYALNVPELADLLPESVFVHLVRDGRDVATSLRAAFGPTRFEDCAEYWMKRVQAAAQAGARLGVRRYLEIRYENLVRAPEPELRAACALAGLDFEPAMLDYRRGISTIIELTFIPQIHGKLRGPLHMARNWREELTREEVSRFESVAGDVLGSLGYPLSGDR